MATYNIDDQQRLAEAERLIRKRANTLGADRNTYSEYFADYHTMPIGRTMRSTPTADTNFASPNYDDWVSQEGAVGTRYGVDVSGAADPIRLHSYVPSGVTGAESCQTFFVIDPSVSNPSSHDPSDLESVRMYPLIGPEFSQGRANAAETSTTTRGFELALYPAKSGSGVGTALVADTDNGPIPITADPGAGEPDDETAGAGDSGYWSVDYDNGIVRFSRPPLNGSGGVMNPNGVYGDINGLEVAQGGGGAITMFAVFYRYTGEYSINTSSEIVTVGDGYVSNGDYEGVGANVLQSAIDSLPDVGGTVFIKGGTYDYVTPVNIPGGVHVVGLGGVKITRPRTEPAFIVNDSISGVVDGYQVLEGVEIYPRDGVVSGGAIELRASSVDEVIYGVKIKNNVIYAEDDGPGIAFAPAVNCTYYGLEISGNTFRSAATSAIYIGERDRGGNVTLVGCSITNNMFQSGDTTASSAISFSSNVVTVSYSHIENNDSANSDFSISSNVSNIVVANNIVDAFNFTGYVSISVFVGNIIGGVSQFSDAGASGGVDSCIVGNNYFMDSVSFPYTSVGSNSASYVLFSGNAFASNLTFTDKVADCIFICNNVDDAVTFEDIDDTKISENVFGYSLSTSSITCSSISNNYFASTVDITSLTETSLSNNYINGYLITTGLINKVSVIGNICLENVNFTYFAPTPVGSVVNTYIVGNYVGGVLNFSGMADNVTISGNKIISITFSYGGMANAIRKSSIIGNVFTDFITWFDNISKTSIIGNYISSDAVFYGLSESTISGNNFDNYALFPSTITDSIISSNFIDGYCNFEDTVTSSVLSNNVFNSSFTISGTSTGAIITNNYSTGAVSLAGVANSSFLNNILASTLSASSSIEYSAFCNNYIASTATFDEYLSDSVISGNVIVGATQFSGTSASGATNGPSDCCFVGNYFQGHVTFPYDNGTSLGSSSFTANVLKGNLTISDLTTTSSMCNNYVGNISCEAVSYTMMCNNYCSSIGCSSTVVDSFVGSNYVVSTLSFTSANGLELCGNIIGSTLQFTSTVIYSFIYTNKIGGAVSITSSPLDSLSNSSMCGNFLSSTLTIDDKISGSNICNNYITGAISFEELSIFALSGNAIGSTFSASSTIANTIISNNYIFDVFSLANVASDSVVSNNVFKSNVTSTSSANSFVRSVISGNVFNACFNLDDLISQSAIVANHFSNAITLQDVQYSSISGNSCANGISSDGACVGLMFTSNYLSSIFTLTYVSGDALTDSFLSYNIFGSTFNVDDGITRTTICGNRFFDEASFEEISYSAIDKNIFDDVVNIISEATDGAVNFSIISENNFNGNVTIDNNAATSTSGVVVSSSIVNNIMFGGNLYITNTQATGSDPTILFSNISNNNFTIGSNVYITQSGNAATSPTLEEVVVTGNTFQDFVVRCTSSNASSGPFYDLTFSGNSAVGIGFYSNATGDGYFSTANFIGNNFYTMGFGFESGPGSSHDTLYSNISIIGNIGSIQMPSDKDDGVGGGPFYDGNAFSNVMIIGNMGHHLWIGSRFALYYSPPTSLSTNPVIALNIFNEYVDPAGTPYYSGIVFDDGVALGWGDNLAETTITNNGADDTTIGIVGTNL
jgi:hypothetical protein